MPITHLVLAMMIGLTANVAASTDVAVERPHLPLPEPTPEQLARLGLSPGDRVAGSVRAWHYVPELVPLLMEMTTAVENSALPEVHQRMVATVVASRNHCLY